MYGYVIYVDSMILLENGNDQPWAKGMEFFSEPIPQKLLWGTLSTKKIEKDWKDVTSQMMGISFGGISEQFWRGKRCVQLKLLNARENPTQPAPVTR